MDEETTMLEDDHWQPSKCDNPWKRNSFDGQSEVYRRMLGILNKVTQSSIQVLISQALELPLHEPHHLHDVFTLLLHKVEDEPLFVSTYAKFFSELASRKEITEQLIAASLDHFRERYENLMSYSFIEDIISPSPEVIKAEFLSRKHAVVTLGFLCELSRVEILPISEILIIGRGFLLNENQRSLECLCRLFHCYGPAIEEASQEFVEESFSYIQATLNENLLPSRLKFLLEETCTLRNNRWRRRQQLRNGNNRGVRG